MKQQTELNRGLEERHITLMSLGAAIGVGLFLGSAKAIQLAGPGSYLVILSVVSSFSLSCEHLGSLQCGSRSLVVLRNMPESMSVH